MMIQTLIKNHKQCWFETGFLKSVFLGLLLLCSSLIFNHIASAYATARAGGPVNDLLLDNLPVFNVDGIVNEGAMLFGIFIGTILFLSPKKIPFILKSVAFFVLVRAIFITFTHLGPVLQHSYIDPMDLFSDLTTGGDYFFSGHTGLPFLLALIFWQNYRVRIVCLFVSVVFGASVILGHLHYSIDVFAAFFISHTIFVMVKRFFRRDYSLFLSSNTPE